MIASETTQPGPSVDKTLVQAPKFESTFVKSNVEKILVLIKFRIIRFFLIWDYFRHPFKTFEALAKLSEVKKAFWGGRKLSKLQKVDGKYFFAMNGPSIFSKGFRIYFRSELNRIYKKEPHQILRVLQIAITKKCTYQCEHCYEWDNLQNNDTLTDDELIDIVRKFQKRGAGQIQLGGGEPMLRYETIIKILQNSTDESEFNIVTSGFQLTKERAFELKRNGLTSVTVSVDHFKPQEHNKFRGFDKAYDWAMAAIENVKEAGLLLNVSLCATKEFVTEENMLLYARFAKKVGASFIWLLEAQSAGRYSAKEVALDDSQVEILETFFNNLNFEPNYYNYPGVAYPSYHQRRLGCFGSGDRYLYVDTNGDLKPCPMCNSKFGSAVSDKFEVSIDEMLNQGCASLPQATV